MSPAAVQSFIVLLVGFAVAGSLASGYQLVTERPLSFRVLNEGARLVTFLAIPVLTFAAPFVIMRNIVRAAASSAGASSSSCWRRCWLASGA
jgi:hypothetical protein